MDPELVNLRKIKRETLQRSMHFRDTTWHLEHLEYLSCGLAGMDSTEQRLHPVEQLGSIFLTTTVAPAVATVVCMIFTWIKYGKPDVSMSLNASLAGLVAITAPCDVTDCFGAIIIGAVAGLLVVFGVWLLDYVLRIDDPVGAVAVHCMNGIWGTIATGLFATTSAPGNDTLTGLFYGGGFTLLGKQLLGMFSVIAWTVVTITITFMIIKATVGLRVSEEEEIEGLDSCEHGLASAYAGFSLMDVSGSMIRWKKMKIHSLAYQNMKQHPKYRRMQPLRWYVSRQWIQVCIRLLFWRSCHVMIN